MIRSLPSLLFFSSAVLVVSIAGCEKKTAPPSGASGGAATSSSSSNVDGPGGPPIDLGTPEPTSSGTPIPLPPDAVTQPLARGNNAFAFDLWQRVKATPGNLTFSPVSISIALAMAYGGAKGTSAAQIKSAMHFEGDGDATGMGWGKLTSSLSGPRPLTLRVANRLFGEKTYTFERAFLDRTNASFGAPLELVDFKKAPDPARLQINAWVEDKTEKRIKDLLPPRSLDESTRLVLVNAIYFLARWETPFKERLTDEKPFDVSPGMKKQVPTMHATDGFPIVQVDGVTVLALPYKENTAKMVFVLPDKVDGLPAVENGLTAAKLDGWMKAAKETQVAVSLPKFEVSPESMPLAKDLMALGMVDVFDREKADLTGMGAMKGDRLSIASVVHKAYVKVDEKGTEAAAATAVAGRGGGVPPKPIEVRLDHPFLFFIVDSATNLVLFVGRVADPTNAGAK